MAHLSVKQRAPLRNNFIPSRRQSRHFASRYRAMAASYTRRRFGGRHPSCGIGVTSRIAVISRPTAWSERMAASRPAPGPRTKRSEEHTSELQSQSNLVCRLLLEKKKKNKQKYNAQ